MDAFVAACQAPAQHQRAVLRRLLTTHSETDVLKRQGLEVPANWPGDAVGGFDQPDPAAAGPAATPLELELLRRLPLTSYADYEPLVERALAAARDYRPGEPACQQRWEAAAAALAGPPPFAFYCSSGTTGGQKRLPASMTSVQALMKGFGICSVCISAAFPQAAEGKELRFAFAHEVETLPNGVQVGVASSINWRRMVQSNNNDPQVERAMARGSSPRQVIVAGNPRACYYLHWLCALARRQDITVLSDIFASSLLLAANMLLEHWPQLMADLRAGRCYSWLAHGSEDNGEQQAGKHVGCSSLDSGGGALVDRLPLPSPEASEAVIAVLVPSAELAEELEQVLEGGRHCLLERLFPNLCHISCILTGSMSKYVPHLRELLPTVPFISAGYGATEGFFALQSDLVEYGAAAAAAAAAAGAEGTAVNAMAAAVGAAAVGAAVEGVSLGSYAAARREADGESSYVMMPETDCYFEFLPRGQTSQEEPATVSLTEVEVGERYELVVSSMQGLFRYRMGDILRCVGHFHKAPKVVVEGRTGQALNIAGEKTPEASLVAAVAAVARELLPGGVPALHEWAAREVLHPSSSDGGDSAGHYVVYWELAAAPAAAAASAEPTGNTFNSKGGLPTAAELAGWAGRLDAALAEVAPMYPGVRQASVSGLELKLVGAGAFEAIRQLAYRRGAAPGQYKPPVTVNNPQQWQLLEQHVLAAAKCA